MHLLRMRRRDVVAGLLALPLAGRAVMAQTKGDYWYDLRADDGSTLPNVHLTAEQMSTLRRLPNLLAPGAGLTPSTLVEFFDYNCPFCRRSAPQIAALAAKQKFDLAFVNIPVLSAASVDAARVESAIRQKAGAAAALAFQGKLMRRKGMANATSALDLAAEMGFDRAAIERLAQAPSLGDELRQSVALADALNFFATPSFVLGEAGIVGYPGPKTTARLVQAIQRCGSVDCKA